MADEQDPKPAEGGNQQQGQVDFQKAFTEKLESLQSQLETQKSEMAGIDRKNSELQKANEALQGEKDSVAKAASANEGTWQTAVTDLNLKLDEKEREAKLSERKAFLVSEAAKRNLDEGYALALISSSQTNEEILKLFDSQETRDKEIDKRARNEVAAGGLKPGSGNIGPDAPDDSSWGSFETDPRWVEQAEKDMKAGMAQ